MGKGSIVKKNYKTSSGYYSASGNTEKMGAYWFFIEPLYGWEGRRFFYVKELEDGEYEVTGEGYFSYDAKGHRERKSDFKKERPKDIYYYHVDESGQVMSKEKQRL